MSGGASLARHLVLRLLPLVLMAPAAALSQVVEVDSGGGVTTYDRPMVFTTAGATPIEVSRWKAPVAARPVGAIWPRIEAQALRHGLPSSLLQAVAWQESRGRTAAVSRKGALGVMQLMPATAAAMGVDPHDPDDNIRGGALYLRRQLDRFGSVPLALAAYNAGPGAVMRFGGVPPFRETRAYVSSIMANWQPSSTPLLLVPPTGESPS